jgi:hypothetical protein
MHALKTAFVALVASAALPALAQHWDGTFQQGIAWYSAAAGHLRVVDGGVSSTDAGLAFANRSTQPAPQCFVATTPYAFGSDQTALGTIGFVVEYDLSWYGTEFVYNTGSAFDVNLEFKANGQVRRRGGAVPLKVRGLHEDRSTINGVIHVSAAGARLSKSGALATFNGEATDIKLEICWLAPWSSVTIRRIGLMLSE